MIPRFSPNYSLSEFFSTFLPSSKNCIKKLENLFTEKSNHKHAIFFRYGRSGLYYLLKALGAKNKKVIMPSYSCVVVANAVIESGNIPIFLDNKKNSFQPNPEEYFKAIDEDTIMVIPTHLFGITQEYRKEYKKIKRKYPHVFVLQDCAHSFFCKDSDGYFIGKWGDGALFGMNISKLVNSVKGGMLTINDTEIEKRIRKNFSTQLNKKNNFNDILKSRLYVLCSSLAFIPFIYNLIFILIKHTNLLNSFTQYYDKNNTKLPKDYCELPLNYNAKIGILSLLKYDKRIENRKKIAKIYVKHLKCNKDIVIPRFKHGYTWSHFPILINKNKKERIISELLKINMEPGFIIDYSISEIPIYYEKFSIKASNSIDTYKRIINLPVCLLENTFNKNIHQKILKICKIINHNT